MWVWWKNWQPTLRVVSRNYPVVWCKLVIEKIFFHDYIIYIQTITVLLPIFRLRFISWSLFRFTGLYFSIFISFKQSFFWVEALLFHVIVIQNWFEVVRKFWRERHDLFNHIFYLTVLKILKDSSKKILWPIVREVEVNHLHDRQSIDRCPLLHL